jgi:hypothetical protein
VSWSQATFLSQPFSFKTTLHSAKRGSILGTNKARHAWTVAHAVWVQWWLDQSGKPQGAQLQRTPNNAGTSPDTRIAIAWSIRFPIRSSSCSSPENEAWDIDRDPPLYRALTAALFPVPCEMHQQIAKIPGKLPVLLFLGIFCGFSDTGRRGRRRLSDCPLASPAGCRNIQWLWLIGRRRPSGDRGELRSAPPPKRRGWNKGAPPPLDSPWPCWCVLRAILPQHDYIGRTAAQAKWSKGGLSIIERMQCMGLS